MAQCALAGCSRAVFVEPSTNKTHKHCGRTHAWKAERSVTSSVCSLPGCMRAVFSDDSGRSFDYCGKTHALEHKSMMSDLSSINDEDEEVERAIRLSLDASENVVVVDDECLDEEMKHAIRRSLEQSFGVDSIGEGDAKRRLSRDWSCSVCTFINPVSERLCDACESERVPTPHRVTQSLATPSMAANKSAEDKKRERDEARRIQQYWDEAEADAAIKATVWTCVTCSTINPATVFSCKQCLEPKDRVEAPSWPCSSCTFDNAAVDVTCFMCGMAIPSSVAISSTGRKSDCGIPGCSRGASHYGFCSSAHCELAVQKNIVSPSEGGIEVVFVGDTGDYTAHLLRVSHPKHASVKKQFLTSWKKRASGVATVERIYWVRVRPDILESFEATKLQLGNVVRRFHGTTQSDSCFFGTIQSKPPCTDESCRVCSICRTGFDTSHIARGPGGSAWNQNLRYGPGFYFSPVSSKSNDYNVRSERLRPHGNREKRFRCMFLCNVVVGRAYVTQEGFLRPTECPPPGYDSVIGETGSNLNYDEVAVYKPTQAIPSYLIVYSLE